jgi:acetyl esterase/lipase
VLDDVQAAPIDKLAVKERWITVPAEVGDVRVRLVRDLAAGTEAAVVFVERLRAAGVPVTTVRYDGITRDFMMLNPLSNTHATRAAIAQATATLRKALQGA